MASNASSDSLGFPVRGMPKTVREKNIIFNVIKYFEDEKERMENKNLDQMQSCKRQQRQLEYRYELFKD